MISLIVKNNNNIHKCKNYITQRTRKSTISWGTQGGNKSITKMISMKVKDNGDIFNWEKDIKQGTEKSTFSRVSQK